MMALIIPDLFFNSNLGPQSRFPSEGLSQCHDPLASCLGLTLPGQFSRGPSVPPSPLRGRCDDPRAPPPPQVSLGGFLASCPSSLAAGRMS